MTNQVTSMELLTLLHKSNYEDTKLSLAERAVLSVIICHINYKLEKGYEAWPSTDIIVTKTGLSTTGISKCRKALVAGGWITVVSGRKAGVANHYFVSAEKIVETAAKSGVVHSGKSVAKTAPIKVVEQHERQQGGLLRGKEAKILVESEPITVDGGFQKWHPIGKFCRSQEEWDTADVQKRIDDMNATDDIPW